NWIVRFRGFYDLPLEKALNIIIPGGYNLSSSSFKETYASQNVTQILQGVVKARYPGLSTLLSSQTTDSSSRLLLIERILERIMLHEIRRIMTGYPFTIGIILSYFILKKNEIKKVQTILNAKQYNIPVDRIKGVI
ncbi:MAG: V-type ATPase subunit, partial [Spirochaetes bacterium]|nr:V-type ATPase subunit [Spirochaetota bacterium]